MNSKKACIASLSGEKQAAGQMAEMSAMCEPCPRAMVMVPVDECETEGDNLDAAVVSKPACKEYFCNVMGKCPEAPTQSPVPGMPQEEYVANLKIIKDNVGTCPDSSRGVQLDTAAADSDSE